MAGMPAVQALVPVSGGGSAAVAEGVVDALVGGGGLAVDAVGVDLQQDGDAVAGDLGGGHPGVQPQRDGDVAQVVGAAGQRGCLLGGVRSWRRARCQNSP